MLYLLDTDMMKLFRANHPAVLANSRRILANPANTIATTVITVEEQIEGWYYQLHRSQKQQDIEDTYFKLLVTVQYFNRVTIRNFSVPAIARFNMLKKQRLNVGGNDLRIAAITLEHAATVVTRNLRDFSRIPGLMVEDWNV
ncbi:hypothetical protein BH11PLA2_BH11PLA2_12650 [soil metagenome]